MLKQCKCVSMDAGYSEKRLKTKQTSKNVYWT